MSKHYCNPLDLPYRYQFNRPNPQQAGPGVKDAIYREAADPSMVLFRDRYWIFPSMTAGFFVSDDLVHWNFHEFVGGATSMPVVDYAPDVRVIGDWMYFCASKMGEPCPFYRCQDPLTEPFERVEGSFAFWDPNMFLDDDGRLYLYWGCSNVTPIWGVELNPETMERKGEPVTLVSGDSASRGFDRIGDDHVPPKTQEQVDAEVEVMVQQMMQAPAEQCEAMGLGDEDAIRSAAMSFLGITPYIEGAWMTKHDGKYYLQYATPGTEYNVYGDAVMIADSPLGPFTLALNNPYSYNLGGFMNGAGHGSTMADRHGKWWHTATMSISVNHVMERRLGLWKAGFDSDGELFCDQSYADWPIDSDAPAWSEPDWMLLSYGAAAAVSSGNERAANLTDENARTWWRADTAVPGQWASIDLGTVCDVHAVQLNFADEGIEAVRPEDSPSLINMAGDRAIDLGSHPTTWLLEASFDGDGWFVVDDRHDISDQTCACSHPFLIHEEGFKARYLRLTVEQMPFDQPACVSGIRVFGHGPEDEVEPDSVQGVSVTRDSAMDMTVSWSHDDAAVGHNVLWGHAPDKLYHSRMVFDADSQSIGALIAGQRVFVRVDAFNQSGIVHGAVVEA